MSGSSPWRWNGSGDELFYVEDTTNRLMAVRVETSPRLQMDMPKALFTGTAANLPLAIRTFRMYDAAPDGQRFVVVQDLVEENRNQPGVSIMVVENWAAEFRGK